jgi:Flp pilus assembly protein TadD
MLKRLFTILLASLLTNVMQAQTPAQEASNGFALFSKTKDFSQLEKAKKAIDRIYKTKKDSASYRNNLLRSLIYSSLAVADAKRSLSYTRDPAEEALQSLKQVDSQHSKYGDEHQQEIVFCRQKLALYFTGKANNDVKAQDYEAALAAYQKVDSLNPGDWKIIHNLALLYDRLGNVTKAEGFYKTLIEDRDRSSPEYYIGFATMYERENDLQKCLDILKKGQERFPDNRDLLFKIIDLYANNNQYEAVTRLVEEAQSMDPKNDKLCRLAAFCYEKRGNYSLAESYYKKAISLNGNNYEANYALGLLYLNLYLEQNKNERLMLAQNYVSRALEIKPESPDTLKLAEILYERLGEPDELEKIRNKLKHQHIN